MSLRLRLVVLVATLTTVVLGGLGLVLASSLRGWTDEVVDAELTRRADVLIHEAHIDDDRLELDDDDDLSARGLPFRIEREDGVLLLGSETWPAAEGATLGFKRLESRNGVPVRVWSQRFVPRGTRQSLVLRVAAPLTAFAQLSERFRNGLLLSLALAAVLSVLGATALAHGFLTPLRRLSREVEHLEARKLEGRLDTRGLDPELGRFARAFNELLARVAEVMAGQRDFVGRASHALRTPLTSILTQAEVALRRERTEAEYRAALESIATATRDAARLSEGLLALTRADSMTAGAEEAVSLPALAVELERLFRPRAEVAGLVWETAVPEGLTVHATHARLREVLDALLDNAFRYTPRGGTVRFTARAEGPRVLLEVTDTGPGIAPEEREQVFERFFRGKAAETSGQPGSGLGLSLVKALVAAEGGELAVAGPPGTRVTISLSAAPRDRPRLQSTS